MTPRGPLLQVCPYISGEPNFKVYPGAQTVELKGPVSSCPEQNCFRKVQRENAEKSKLVGVSRDRDLRGAAVSAVAHLSSRALGVGAPARALWAGPRLLLQQPRTSIPCRAPGSPVPQAEPRKSMFSVWNSRFRFSHSGVLHP